MELQEQGPVPRWLMLFHAALLTGAGQNKPASSHPLGENWASLRPNITIKSQTTLPEEQIYDLIILWLDKHIFHHVYLYRKRNLLFLQTFGSLRCPGKWWSHQHQRHWRDVWMWHLGTQPSGGLGSVTRWWDLMILRVFANQNDSVVLFCDPISFMV